MTDAPPPHPALGLEVADRRSYASVLASLAYADGHLDEREEAKLAALSEALELGAEGHAAVLEAARSAGQTTIGQRVQRWRGTEMAVPLLTDAIVMAFADSEMHDDESQAIGGFALMLGVHTAKATMIARHVLTMTRGEFSDGEAEAMARKLGVDIAEVERTSRPPGAVSWLLGKLRGQE